MQARRLAVVPRAVRIGLFAVLTQLFGLMAIFVMFAASPDYLRTLTISLVLALLHVLSASVFIRTSPRWCVLLILPISVSLAIALVVNAPRFASVFSQALSEQQPSSLGPW